MNCLCWQARTLPERQALAYDATRPHGLDTSVSVLLKHRDLPSGEIYQEVVRSRALVADEMARRQKNLNSDNDPETGRLLKELNQARIDIFGQNSKSQGADKTGVVIWPPTRPWKRLSAPWPSVARSSATRNEFTR